MAANLLDRALFVNTRKTPALQARKITDIWLDYSCLYDTRSSDFKNRDLCDTSMGSFLNSFNTSSHALHLEKNQYFLLELIMRMSQILPKQQPPPCLTSVVCINTHAPLRCDTVLAMIYEVLLERKINLMLNKGIVEEIMDTGKS